MSLVDLTLLGTTDKVATAIERVQAFVPELGYYVAFSGGKDSIAVLDIVRRAGVPFDAHYNWTTVDPPELARFIRDEYPFVEWERPATTMWKLIVQKRMPPTRMVRYCCREFKEGGGSGRTVVTGIRWAESTRRKNSRRMVESCFRDGSKAFLNPIIDWTDDDVWEYIHDRGLAYPSLYDEGFKRLGCILCPMQMPWAMRRDAKRWPKVAAAYEHAFQRMVDVRRERGLETQWRTGKEVMHWWISANQGGFDRHAETLFPLEDN